MLSLEKAQQQIFSLLRPCTRQEMVSLAEADGRSLAADLPARLDNPAFDNSAMDGYALALNDLAGGRTLPLRGEASCGDAPATLQAGSCMRIFTGAPMPAGADTVAIQEEVTVEGGQVSFPSRLSVGDNVRRHGEDFSRGQPLYRAGRRLRPTDLALLAVNGYGEIPVWARPRVLVLATGNELLAPGAGEPGPGQIFESNRFATMAALRRLGAQVEDGGILPDDREALRQALAGAEGYDFIITSGGASVGDHDLVRDIFTELGQLHLWRVRIKPGKPVAFGLLGEHCHFFALPGNPVSALVTLRLFAEPALRVWSGGSGDLLLLPARMVEDFRRRGTREEYLRAVLTVRDGVLEAAALPGQESHMLAPIARANGLIRVPADCDQIRAGEPVQVMPLYYGEES